MVSPHNDYYGHRAILNGYMGLPVDTAFLGVVQHGWQLPPWTSTTAPAGHLRYYAWASSREPAPGRRVRFIGAPFLYLDAVRAWKGPAPRARLLVLPYHAHGVDLDGAHQRYAAGLRGLSSDYEVTTVCLHPIEYRTAIRSIYEDAGFSVVTNGDRHDPQFLLRMIDLLQAHGTVTTNRMSTGMLYAAFLGHRVYVTGPFARSADRAMSSVPYEEQYRAYRSSFADFESGLEGAAAHEVAARELGAAHVLPPGELRDALGAVGGRQQVARAVRQANRVRKSLVRRRYGPTSEALGRSGEQVVRLFDAGIEVRESAVPSAQPSDPAPGPPQDPGE